MDIKFFMIAGASHLTKQFYKTPSLESVDFSGEL